MGVGRGTQGVMLEATWSLRQLLFCIPESRKLHILISICLELLKGRPQWGSSMGHQGRPSSELSTGSVCRKHGWT